MSILGKQYIGRLNLVEEAQDEDLNPTHVLTRDEGTGDVYKTPVSIFPSDDNVLHTTGDEIKNGALNISPANGVAPLAPLHVGDRSVSNSSNAKILVSGNYDDDVSGNGHAFSDSSELSKSGSWAYAGFDGRVDVNGTGVDADHYVSFQHAPVFNFSGIISKVWGSWLATAISSGTIDSNYGIYIANPVKTGTGVINQNVALWIEEQLAGNSNFAIYAPGVGNRMYLGGSANIDGRINAGAEVRVKAPVGVADLGVLVGSDGSYYFSDWDLTRGFKVNTGGSVEIIGSGNLRVGGGTDTGEDLQVATTIRSNASPMDFAFKIGNGTILNITGGGDINAQNFNVVQGQVANAPTAPTDVVRLQDLGIKTTATTSSTVVVNPATATSYRLNTGVTNVTLPALSGNEGKILFLINNTGVSVNVNSNTGGNDIWDGGSSESTTVLAATVPMRLLHDGTQWVIL